MNILTPQSQTFFPDATVCATLTVVGADLFALKWQHLRQMSDGKIYPNLSETPNP